MHARLVTCHVIPRLLAGLAAAALVALAALPAAADDAPERIKVPVGPRDPARGPADAPVTIVEFTDFQCPYCARVQPTLAQLARIYGPKLRLVCRHNPMPFHADAGRAAEATLAAHAQGRFWQLHDRLFADPQALGRADLERHAEALGLDLAEFRAALDEGRFRAAVEADQALATRVGARGVPTFFINGRPVRGAVAEGEFRAIIDEELATAGALLRQGVPARRVYEELQRTARAALAPAPPRATPAQADPAKTYRVPVGPQDPVRGPRDAPVTVVAFVDYQCPFSARVQTTLADLARRYGREVRIVAKHDPLPFHQHAALAAEAALAAHAQGRFWELHDALFANQTALARADLERHAAALGLDPQAFGAALDQGTYRAAVAADQALAARVGARGTPAFFINGRFLSGAQPLDSFRTLVDAELARARGLMRERGLTGAEVYAEAQRGALEKAEGAPPPPPARAEPDPSVIYKVPVGRSPVLGAASAPITVVVFTDYECPFCLRVEATLAELRARYGKDLRLVYKHNPLPFHPHAGLAAEAALAAQAQGRFAPMHERLFAAARALERPDLERYAGEIGLDLRRFRATLDAHTYRTAIEADQRLAEQVGARGTPTFFINGRILVGAQPLEEFVARCDAARDAARALGAKRRLRPERVYDELMKGGVPRVAAP